MSNAPGGLHQPSIGRRGDPTRAGDDRHRESDSGGPKGPPGPARTNKATTEWTGEKGKGGGGRRDEKKFSTLPDLCVSSLRRGHANLLCIVPILTDDPRRESNFSGTPNFEPICFGCWPARTCLPQARTLLTSEVKRRRVGQSSERRLGNGRGSKRPQGPFRFCRPSVFCLTGPFRLSRELNPRP